ncbi:MAG: gluconate 2-dehydrogenase subunit 3 family protein [Gemmatimonadota bacterium]|nr:gluconate 2-dehydrogenase subunit 3 family protein [Gemmatimonadota bacterium]
MPEGISRRDAVAALTGVAASVWAAADARIAQAVTYAAQARAGQAYQALTATQARELDAVTATLVPTDDTPGAREARVVRFIDRSLATWAKDQKPEMNAALTALGDFTAAKRGGNRSFAAVPAAERTALMEEFEKAHADHFNGAFWFPTMAGMFANPSYGGNANKVGWKLVGFTDQFSWSPPFGYYDRG